MKSERKTPDQLAQEKEEMNWLTAKILDMTNRIPPKVLNEGSQQAAVTFKRLAVAARKQAESARPTLDKLRTAHQSIATYY